MGFVAADLKIARIHTSTSSKWHLQYASWELHSLPAWGYSPTCLGLQPYLLGVHEDVETEEEEDEDEDEEEVLEGGPPDIEVEEEEEEEDGGGDVDAEDGGPPVVEVDEAVAVEEAAVMEEGEAIPYVLQKVVLNVLELEEARLDAAALAVVEV